jgi:hypothetical protein
LNIAAMAGWGCRRMVKKVNSCMMYLILCMNLYKCHNVPPSITTIKIKKREKLLKNRTHYKVGIQDSLRKSNRCMTGGPDRAR